MGKLTLLSFLIVFIPLAGCVFDIQAGSVHVQDAPISSSSSMGE